MSRTAVMESKLSGHKIACDKTGSWYFQDTGEPTVGHNRDCGYCGNASTKEGHDGCLGTLPNVQNACCGHGIERLAYIHFNSGEVLRGEDAIKIFRGENNDP